MHEPDATVGMALAKRVATRLEAGEILAYSHRDYCGTGLRFADGEYIYGRVYDGLLPSTTEAWHGQLDEDIDRKTFGQRAEFLAWLDSQTDESLSGENLPEAWHRNNQRVTIERLQRFIEGGA
jgi:hypothetical protein